MSGRLPLVSVVIPAYNVADLVGRAIDSVLGQTYQSFEILVVDDGSGDETAAVAAARSDAAVRVISKQNRGLSSARNRGIDEATGEYIAYLDADDYWEPGKLESQIGLLQANPDLGFCSTAARVIDDRGETMNVWSCPSIQGSSLKAIFSRNATVAGSGSGVVVRTRLQRRVGYFDENLRSLEDIDMWMRLSALTGYACIDNPLAVILKRPDSMSRHLDVMRDSAIRVMRKNRHLLDQRDQGRFWQGAYASVLADYAKWEYREGRVSEALRHLGEAAVRAPISRGRLCASLCLAMIRGEEL